MGKEKQKNSGRWGVDGMMKEQLMMLPDQLQHWTSQVRKIEGQMPKNNLITPTLDQPLVKGRWDKKMGTRLEYKVVMSEREKEE